MYGMFYVVNEDSYGGTRGIITLADMIIFRPVVTGCLQDSKEGQSHTA